MNCIFCGHPTHVLETRLSKANQFLIYRRRECLKCKARVRTQEVVSGKDWQRLSVEGSAGGTGHPVL